MTPISNKQQQLQLEDKSVISVNSRRYCDMFCFRLYVALHVYTRDAPIRQWPITGRPIIGV